MDIKIFYKTIIFFFVLFFASSAQVNNCEISGHVWDVTGYPLSEANVFLSGTTWGAKTDKNGFYKISSVKSGKFELVISLVGYEVISKNISLSENSGIKIDFKLTQKSYELNPIDVISERPKEWLENLETFNKFFLGSTKFAKDCIVKNEIKIEFDKKENILSARTDEPIFIYNRSLGYRIYCVLLNFVWNSSESRIQFQVKPRFEEMIPSSGEEKNIWQKNREEVYKGSLTHFLRSLINDEFINEGYKLYFSLLPTESKNTSKLEQVFSSKKLLQRGVIPNEYILKFQNYLRVFRDDNLSWIKLCYPEVTIDKYGNAEEPVPFETYGYWAKSGIADMLPYNYVENDY